MASFEWPFGGGGGGGSVTFPILAPNGSAGAPSYSFSASQTTGMYSPGADEIGWSIAGVEEMQLSSSDLQLLVPIQEVDGAASVPSYSFTNSPTAGMFSPGPNQLGWSANGVSQMTLSNTTFGLSVPAQLGSALFINTNTVSTDYAIQ